MGLWWFRLEKGKRRGDLIAVLHCLKGSNRECRDTLFSIKGQQENRQEQQDGKFQIQGKKFFSKIG